MFAIEVELLAGRYVATRYNDRTRAEWPPHPARLFSALVATHYAKDPPVHAERLALEWLERQAPPSLHASLDDETAEREPYTVFVPVNDPTVIGDFEEDRSELTQAEAEAASVLASGEVPKRGSPAAKALARVEKLRKSLADKVRKATSPTDKITTESLKQAASLFPEQRVRQPRTFPSIRPADPRVVFVWPDAETKEHAPVLASLLERLVRLGHSASLVRARLINDPPTPNWRPDPLGGHRLRVVREGQLRALDDAFALHQETQPRVLPASFANYTTQPKTTPVVIPASHFADDWVVLRRTGGAAAPSTATASIAKTFRRALMSFAEQPAPEILTGHAEGGVPSTGLHLAIVALPFVGHVHADGSILGIALVMPRGALADERRAAFRALAAWEKKGKKSDDEELPEVPLHLGPAGDMQLQRLEERADQSTLRPEIWCAPARHWATATPVALDRNPGELRDRNPERAAAAAREAERIVSDAFEHIGLPRPSRITICPHAPLAGARKVKWFPPYPEQRDKTRRVLTHVDVEFEMDVRGPILIGAGRYHGLGLFKPVRDDA